VRDIVPHNYDAIHEIAPFSQAILFGCATLNLCGSFFVIVYFYLLRDIRQSARGLWHLLIKSVAVVPLTASYLMFPLARNSTFWCNTRFVCETISAPVFLVAELCISLEILFAVRSALTQSHISRGVGLIRGIYVLAMGWGMIAGEQMTVSIVPIPFKH
jgi:hypothetical protein